MKPDDLEPLSESMKTLLASEQPLQPVPADVKARLFERLSSSIANMPGGSGSSGPSGPGAGSSGTAGAAKLAPGALGGAATAGKVVIGIVSFSLGGVVGAGLHAAATRDERPTMVATSQPSAAPAVPAEAPLAPAEPPRPPVEAGPGAPHGAAAPPVAIVPAEAQATGPARPAPAVGEHGSKPSSAAATPSPASPDPVARSRPGDSLGAERSLVEQARAALARHDAPAALAALGSHQAQFPLGQLAEERTALQVMALVESGQQPRARELAQLFRAQYPQSLLLPAVEASVRGAAPEP